MLDWWTEVGLATSSFLDRHGLLAAFVFLLIEEAGVPVPVPGDVAMLALGVHGRRESNPYLWLVQAIGTTWIATMLGSSGLYFGCRWAGRGLVYRYGRFIRLTPERLDKAEQWLKKHGTRAVFFGRLVPGLRIVTTVACGVFEVPFRVFFPAMSLGALLYILVYTLLGYSLGEPVLNLLEKIHLPFGLLGSLVPLALLLWWTIRARQDLGKRGTAAVSADRELKLRSGAMAGLLATVGSTLVMNVLLNLAGGIAFNAPGTLVERTAARLAFALARDVQPIFLFIAVPAYVAVGVMWGAVYGAWGEARLPARWADWQKGVAFAGLPLLVSVLVVLPILGMGLLGLGATGPVAFTGELIRHAVFGGQLGLMFPVFRARRPIKVRPHTPAELAAEPAVRAEV
ncbi:MAG TPA: DedA family protein [Chloroflexota bacterium]|jgi:membrane protein DedA with SNARE-associated domain